MPWSFVPALWRSNQPIYASLLNVMVKAITELQASNDPTLGATVAALGADVSALDATDTWTVGTFSGTGWTGDYAYRIVGRRTIDMRTRVVYASPPSSLSLTHSGLPAATIPDVPPGFPINAVNAFVFGRAAPSTDRVIMPGFFGTGSALIRGGSSNPLSLDTFECMAIYSISA